MFEQFNQQARQVVVEAQQEARQLSHAHIGTEHILLGLLWDVEEVPAQALSAFGVDAETVRAQVIERLGRGTESTPGQIPFTQRAKKVLELSLRERLTLGHTMIRPGHLLLGLLNVEDGLAVEILLDLNVTPETLRERVVELLREQVVELLGEPEPEGEPEPRVKRVVAADVRFTIKPDQRLLRLLRAAGGRALREQRDEFSVADLLAVVREMPESRGLLDPDAE
jgi:ATP-dependent Clp protease ATP-binding subunit ClpC